MDNEISFKIIDATPSDASFIAETVMTAVGNEICEGMAGSHPMDSVRNIFTRLAGIDESQYSWRNTRLAVDSDGNRLGACVSYDGARLRQLRRSFFKEANATLGWGLSHEDVENVPEETDGKEFYLDSLMVVPQARNKGIASALIEDASRKAASTGKPLGLLVDTENPRARRLYDSLGFQPIGIRPFAGVEMHHMQKN